MHCGVSTRLLLPQKSPCFSIAKYEQKIQLSFFLIIAALPFLSELRQKTSFQGVLVGVNASVVGILLAAFYDPVIKSSINSAPDFALAMLLFALLNKWKLPAWSIVIIGVAGGYVLNLLGF